MISKEYMVKGKKITLFTISDLANALGRETVTIRKWENLGFIPRAAMRTKSGFRLYTKDEIEILVRIVREEKLANGHSFAKTKFKERAFSAWAKLRKDSGMGAVAQVINGVHSNAQAQEA